MGGVRRRLIRCLRRDGLFQARQALRAHPQDGMLSLLLGTKKRSQFPRSPSLLRNYFIFCLVGVLVLRLLGQRHAEHEVA